MRIPCLTSDLLRPRPFPHYLRMLSRSRFTSSPAPLLSPLLGLSSSKTLTEMTTQEQVIPEVRGTEAVETLVDSTPAVSVLPTSVAGWRLRHTQLTPQPEALTIPPENVLSSSSGFLSHLLRAYKLKWGDSPHDMYICPNLVFVVATVS